MIFNRYKTCRGIKLWKWNNFQVELWYCPRGFKIEPHSHDNQNIELTFLFGKATFRRRLKGQDKVDSAKVHFITDMFTTFSIPAGTEHSFEVSNWPLVFINRERWLTKPTSAALDFQPTK